MRKKKKKKDKRKASVHTERSVSDGSESELSEQSSCLVVVWCFRMPRVLQRERERQTASCIWRTCGRIKTVAPFFRFKILRSRKSMNWKSFEGVLNQRKLKSTNTHTALSTNRLLDPTNSFSTKTKAPLWGMNLTYVWKKHKKQSIRTKTTSHISFFSPTIYNLNISKFDDTWRGHLGLVLHVVRGIPSQFTKTEAF